MEIIRGHLEPVDSLLKTPILKPCSMWDMSQPQAMGKDGVPFWALGMDGAFALTFLAWFVRDIDIYSIHGLVSQNNALSRGSESLGGVESWVPC